jgi:FkbM family methyltransferase
LVSEREGEEYQFDMYNEPALNSAITARRENLLSGTHYAVEETITLKARRLDSILDEYVPEGVEIDFLSIDVEGLDLEVVNSNNWDKYRPTFVLAETYIDMDDPLSNEICIVMKQHGYKLRSFLHLTAVFVKA